ncbi:MAG: GGDEF domain-containing protein [Deltaproteobacteria bacterium]|nr:GGDEF domain-containing protein [Deltaproteobacteria bacterium]
MSRQEPDISATQIIRRELIELAVPEDKQASVLITSGSHIGQTYQLEDDESVIGRGPECAIVLEDDGISRLHCRFRREDHDTFVLEDLDSTNGTWVNRARIKSCRIKSGDRIRIGVNTTLRFMLESGDDHGDLRELYQTAIRDALTGVFNKRYLLDRLRAELAYARRHGSPLSVLIFDLDDFKGINDTFGHGAGDTLLAQLGALLLEHTREEDVVARFGGDEFVIVARGTSEAGARDLAERLRRAVLSSVFEDEGRFLRTTLSLGTATTRGEARDIDTLLREADRALYAAKQQGKNRVGVVAE